MSKASEYAMSCREHVDEIQEAQKAYNLLRETRPAFSLREVEGPEYRGRNPRTFTVSETGCLLLKDTNSPDFPASPAEARKLAIWILETFAE